MRSVTSRWAAITESLAPAPAMTATTARRSAAVRVAACPGVAEHARRYGARHSVPAAKQVQPVARRQARLARHQAQAARAEARLGPDRGSEAPEDRHRNTPFFGLYVVFVVVAAAVMVLLAMGTP